MSKVHYSKTAKQRRAERQTASIQAGVPVNTREGDTVAVSTRKPITKKTLIAIIAVAMVVVTLLTTTIILLVRGERFPNDNPVAEFHMSDGSVLEFELYYDVAPTAVSNFVHYANLGFFNNSVVHNIQNNTLRAGLYDEYTSDSIHRYITQRYKDTVEDKNRNQYSYSVIKQDSSNTYKTYDKGYLSTTLSSYFKSEFRMCLDGSANIPENSGIVFGYARGDKTFAALDKLNKTPVNPVFVPALKINSVKIKANNRKHWKNYNFFSDHIESADFIYSGIY